MIRQLLISPLGSLAFLPCSRPRFTQKAHSRCSAVCLAALLIFGLFAVQAAAADTVPKTHVVTFPKPPSFTGQSYSLRAGEAHLHPVPLKAGQCLEIEIEQHGIDVVIDVMGPNEEPLANFDSPTGHRGSESVFVMAEVSGIYQLRLGTPYLRGASGQYRMRSHGPRQATEKDRYRGQLFKIWLRAQTIPHYPSVEQAADSLKLYLETLCLARLAEDQVSEAWAWTFIANYYNFLGRPIDALAANRTALEHWKQLGHMGMVVGCQIFLARLHASLKELQTAFHYTHLALATAEPLEDPRWKGRALEEMAYLHARSGGASRAIEALQQILLIWRQQGLKDKEIQALDSLAHLYESLDETGQAIEYFSAIPPLAAVSERRRHLYTLSSYLSLGRCFATLGKRKRAEEMIRLARELYDTADSPAARNQLTGAHFYFQLGRIYQILDEASFALEQYQIGLGLSEQQKRPLEKARILHRIAQLQRNQGSRPQALKAIEEAVEILESRRARVRDDRFQALFRSSQDDYYRLWITLLMELHEQDPTRGFDQKAFLAHERSRARSLIQTFVNRRSHNPTIADPALVTRERLLQQRLSKLIRGQVGSRSSHRTASASTLELTDLLTELTETQAQISSKNLVPGASLPLRPITLQEIQRHVLDRETVLLEYSLGQDHSYLWVVTRDTFNSHVLPSRQEIEQLTDAYLSSLIQNTLQSSGDPPIETHSSVKEAGAEESGAEGRQTANGFSRLLPASAFSGLRDPKGSHLRRILVVADGPLQSFPFAALPTPGSPEEPLIAHYEMVSAPSAWAIDVLRRHRPQRPQNPTHALAMVADPVFKQTPTSIWQGITNLFRGPDEVAGPGATIRQGPGSKFRLAGLSTLEPLTGARSEAESILKMLPANQSLRAMGHEATRELVLDGALSPFRIVHFATHALSNHRHPSLSGIVLSLVDRKGRPLDGFLRLDDIYRLRLQAELVVLSACRTALGREIRGEGLMSLSLAFMVAGAPSVVASLWSPEDRATAELMTRFYQGMLQRGLAPSEALRQAQVSLWHQGRPPSQWAAFVLQGDWQAAGSRKSSTINVNHLSSN